MRNLALFIALFGVIALASAQYRQHQVPREEHPNTRPTRFRRQEPQGSLVIRGEKPLSGPDRRPSLDIDYNRRIHDANGFNTNAYGGVNIRPGQPAQPHVGLNFEKEYRNGFIGGYGQAQRGPGNRVDPSFGIRGGFRFRRDADDFQAEEEEY